MKFLRVRLDEELGEGLDRLKIERHVNLSAWVRSLIRPALAEQLETPPGWVGTLPPPPESPPPPTDPEPTTAPEPIPGWFPSRLEDGEWGARFEGDTRAFPDDLAHQVIEITTKGGDSWTASVVEVLHWEKAFVLVRHSGKE